jgi:acyl-CoA thioester hydrolase
MENIQSTRIQMRYGDLDALGHVNNAVFLTYYELGRTNFFMQYLGGFISRDVNFVVNHAEIDFKAPIHFEDDPVVLTWISQIGRTSCVFSHKIISEDYKRIFSEGKTVVVWIDENLKKKEIPMDIREKLEELMVNYV